MERLATGSWSLVSPGLQVMCKFKLIQQTLHLYEVMLMKLLLGQGGFMICEGLAVTLVTILCFW